MDEANSAIHPSIHKHNYMRALAFHLPLILIMLSATAWVFIIAAHNPGWFRQPAQKRAFYCAVEGVLSAFVWSFISIITEQLFAVQDLLNPAVAGLAWGAMSFFGKSRFKATVEATEQQHLRQIYRR